MTKKIRGVNPSPFLQEILVDEVNSSSDLELVFDRGSGEIERTINALDSGDYSGVCVTNPAGISKGRTFKENVEEYGAYSGSMHIIKYAVARSLPVLVNVPFVDFTNGKRFLSDLKTMGISEERGNLHLGTYDLPDFVEQIKRFF